MLSNSSLCEGSVASKNSGRSTVNKDDELQSEPLKSDPPKKRRWWLWALGLLLLLALCDDDDRERERQYCYTFGEDKRLCFAQPLPEDQDCFLEADDAVRCYERQR